MVHRELHAIQGEERIDVRVESAVEGDGVWREERRAVSVGGEGGGGLFVVQVKCDIEGVAHERTLLLL